jgi:hypothetical protein
VSTSTIVVGRRLSSQAMGELVSQHNPDEPVKKIGHWKQLTVAERDKQSDVHRSQVRTFAFVECLSVIDIC